MLLDFAIFDIYTLSSVRAYYKQKYKYTFQI